MQENEKQAQSQMEIMQGKKCFFSTKIKQDNKTTNLKNNNIQQKNFNNINNNKVPINKNIHPSKIMVPQDSLIQQQGKSEKFINGEKKLQKKIIKKGGKGFRKPSNSFSEKNLPIFSFSNLNKLNQNMEIFPKDGLKTENNNEKKVQNTISSKKNVTIIDKRKDNENGYSQKRALTPKKKSQDIKIVPFDSIEKELILEPKLIDSTEQQISFSRIDDLQSIYESFFIASLPKNEYSFAEDINNPGVSYCSQNLSQCGHEFCIKLPAYKAGLIFKYPPIDKNKQNFEISELVTSLCFPFGIKICFGKYGDKKKEIILPKKPSDFYFVTTNGFNDQNYVYVYNFYLKVEIEKFKKIYKCDPIKSYLDLLIKNNDRNLQNKFEECQKVINTQYVFIPHVCCLVSKYPYFKEMRKSIYSILKLRNNEDELIKFLKNIIYEIPDINKYKNYDLQLNYFTPYNMFPIVLKSKYYNRGLSIDIKEMKILYEYFQISILLKIFKFMLTSQKLLFVVGDSSEYKSLGVVTLALLNLLYPFNWKYTYIPILSFNMLKFLQSFLPFIMGIDNNMMEYAKSNYIEKQNNITIIYLRKNRKSYIDVENPDENALIEIPSELKDMLSNDLKTIMKTYSPELKDDNILSKLSMFGIINMNHYNKIERDEQIGKQLRQVFLKFFVEIFGDYQEYTSSIDDTAYFNSESFLNNIPKEYHNFYLSIFNSEMFHDFLQRNVVVNSTLYKPDKYYNKYCMREKRTINFFFRDTKKKDLLKKKRTFLDLDEKNIIHKQSSKFSAEELNRRKIINHRPFLSTKMLSNIGENTKDYFNTSDDDIIDFGKNDFKKSNDNNDNDSSFASQGEDEDMSLNSSFNQETLKKCVNEKFTNKYIIPPCFLKMQNKDLSLEDIEEIILNFYGEDKLIKKNEYENKYIFDKLPIIDYEGIKKIEDKSLKETKLDELDSINRYLLPGGIVMEYFQKPKRNRSHTLSKLNKDNRLDPKIIQLEDFMKEILSSSGKNASNILYPKGIKEIKSHEKNSQKDSEKSSLKNVEKSLENGKGNKKGLETSAEKGSEKKTEKNTKIIEENSNKEKKTEVLKTCL